MYHPEIYLVRHGETEWNRSRRYQGQLDSRLTENGIRQAAYVGNLISKIIPNLEDIPFYCSPLGRCRETAARICNAAALDPKKLIYEDYRTECMGTSRMEVYALCFTRLSSGTYRK